MTEFAAPAASGGSFNISEHNGHLVVVEVLAYQTGIVTSLGEKDAISATIHDIDAQVTIEDALIFPKVLVGSLKSRVGQKVLATVGQGVAKPGQNAPWVLNDASGDPAAAARATAYLQAYAAGQFAAPAAEAAPAAAAPAGAPAGAPAATPEQLAALEALKASGLIPS